MQHFLSISPDEFNCTTGCNDDDFQCDNGKCIMGVWKCDRNPDCSDGSDEANCTDTVQCPEGQFSCGHGQCIPLVWVCDGNYDCHSKADEANCTRKTCQADDTSFKCGGGDCIPRQWVCDGEADCSDESDEKECSMLQCNDNEFRCSNHICIDKSLVCDRRPDCIDKSDETDCNYEPKACLGGTIPCTSDGHCIYPSDLCDGHVDCEDGEDERNCTHHDCSDHEVHCDPAFRDPEFPVSGNVTATCIPKAWLCDGENDCGDWSDERRSQCLHRNADRITTTTGRPCKDGSFPCDSGECIPYESVCDNHKDCLDGSDEGFKCLNACGTNKGGCHQECRQTPQGALCYCIRGYEVDSKNISHCVDIDECREKSLCSHYCNNTQGSFKCSCAPGYQLASDGKRCKAIHHHEKLEGIVDIDDSSQPTEPHIIYMLPDRIRSLGLVSHSEHLLVDIASSDISGFDVDYESQTIFWAESRTGAIMYAQLFFNGTRGTPTPIREHLFSPTHLSWDWIGRNFYFFSNGYIAACNEQGMSCTNIIPTGYTMINSLVIVPEDGLLFYSVFSSTGSSNGNGLIERANMNGAKKSRIVYNEPNVRWPNGLTVDNVLKRLYWADAFLGQVGMCDYDGKHREVLLAYSLAHPYGLTLFEDSLYIANMGSDTMTRLSKFNGRGRTIFHRGNVKTEVMKIYHQVTQPQAYMHKCKMAGCEKLCLLRPAAATAEGQKRWPEVEPDISCSCPAGYRLSTENVCAPDSDVGEFMDSLSVDHIGFSCNEPSACQNGGTCEGNGNAFKCHCSPGYSGLHCEFLREVGQEERLSEMSQSSDVFGVTLTVLAIIALVIILAIVVNYYFEGPVSMEAVRQLSPRRNPFRNMTITFKNPLFKRDDSSLLESEERMDDFEESVINSPHHPQHSVDYVDDPDNKGKNFYNNAHLSLIRNQSAASNFSEFYEEETFENVDLATSTSITTFHRDTNRLLP